jgi:hypothetical protein
LKFGDFLTQSRLIIIGGNSSFHYLIQRYAEKIGCAILPLESSITIDRVCKLHPMGVIFASLENLESSRTFAAGLANRDVPIIVCSSVADQARARQCGADYCLLHPFAYDNFSLILDAIASANA